MLAQGQALRVRGQLLMKARSWLPIEGLCLRELVLELGIVALHDLVELGQLVDRVFLADQLELAFLFGLLHAP